MKVPFNHLYTGELNISFLQHNHKTPISSEYWIQRSHINKEEFEDTKGVIRIHISKRNRQHNGPKDRLEKTKETIKYG